MSPTLQMASPSTYTTTSDVMERHEYGVTKSQSRKASSTGGGRAWSDDEVGHSANKYERGIHDVK